MKIANFYSHLNGWEHILVHKPHIWTELQEVVEAVDAEACKTKVSKERRTLGRLFYSPKDMNVAYKERLQERGWGERTTRYFVTDDELLILRTMHMTAAEQRASILAAGKVPIASYKRTGFIKEKIEFKTWFGKDEPDFTTSLSEANFFFRRRVTDVSILALPIVGFQKMSWHVQLSFEAVIDQISTGGRNAPPIPLVIVGISL